MFDMTSEASRNCFLEIHKNVVRYRETQAKKYFAEQRSDYCNYSTAERYKNRVRVVDLFLFPVETWMIDNGLIEEFSSVKEIP